MTAAAPRAAVDDLAGERYRVAVGLYGVAFALMVSRRSRLLGLLVFGVLLSRQHGHERVRLHELVLRMFDERERAAAAPVTTWSGSWVAPPCWGATSEFLTDVTVDGGPPRLRVLPRPVDAPVDAGSAS